MQPAKGDALSATVYRGLIKDQGLTIGNIICIHAHEGTTIITILLSWNKADYTDTTCHCP
jgi:hypothetical protein